MALNTPASAAVAASNMRQHRRPIYGQPLMSQSIHRSTCLHVSSADRQTPVTAGTAFLCPKSSKDRPVRVLLHPHPPSQITGTLHPSQPPKRHTRLISPSSLVSLFSRMSLALVSHFRKHPVKPINYQPSATDGLSRAIAFVNEDAADNP